MKHFALLAAAALATLPATSAQAATYLYELTGDYTATFEIESDRLPDQWDPGANTIFWDVPGSYQGTSGSIVDVTFFNINSAGGLYFYDMWAGAGILLVTDGPQLYSGPEETPTLLTGTFSLVESYGGTGTYTLKVTDLSAVAPVPEPGTWAMMIGGFGLMGGLMRRRRRANVKVSFA